MAQDLRPSIKIPLVPQALVPEVLASRIQSESLNDRRNVLINELRCIYGIPEVASTMKAQELYTIVLKPEGSYMQIDSAGYFQAVWRKNGKIVQHTRLQEVKPSIVKAASAIGTQVMLISIAMQLNRIEKRLTNLEKEFHNDRISEIKAGISIYNQAIEANHKDSRLGLVMAAIQELTRGIEKNLTSLKQQIENTPDIKIDLFDNWGSNKSAEANEKFKMAEESFQASLMGIQTLAECYAIIDEPRVASTVLKSYIEKINFCGIESAAKKARLVPYKNGSLPEIMWISYLDNRDTISSRIENCRSIANNRFECIEIQVKPEELIGEFQ